MESRLTMDYEQVPFPFFDDGSPPQTGQPIINTQIEPSLKASNFDVNEFAIFLLALGQINGVGIQTLKTLVRAYSNSNVSSIWREDQDVLTEILKKGRIRESGRISSEIKIRQKSLIYRAEETYQELIKSGIKIITPRLGEWPRQLLGLPDAPEWLFVQGDCDSLREPLIGIVGTREPSKIALNTTSRLASVIADQGLGIVSGLAEGIDAIAHKAGLNYQVPQVAVLGTSIDVVYPASTKQTRQRLLAQGGVIISEYLPGSDPTRGQFVERNRIQAGLSTALVPIEGKRQSGTQHTIEFAQKYGRPLFGVIRTEASPGNELIDLLKERNYPIFDLDTPQGKADLTDWLKFKIGPKKWPQRSYSLVRENVFRSVLNTLDSLFEYVPLDQSDLDWFQNQVAQRYQKHSTSDDEL